MVLQENERARRGLGPQPAFGGVAVHLRWDPEHGGWHRERQRPSLPAVATPPLPTRDPAAPEPAAERRAAQTDGLVAQGQRRSPARPRPPLLVALVAFARLALALGSGRARAALGMGDDTAGRQGYHGPPINMPVNPVDARPGRT